jgi:formiminotetrahydrofolate cyclodeaminase
MSGWDERLDAIAGADRGHASGVAATLAATAAAATVLLVARESGQPGLAAQAAALRRRLDALAATEAEVYAAAVEALGARDAGPGRPVLATALADAAGAPLAIARTAADVAALAAEVAPLASPDRAPDAAAAAALAEGAVRAAALLVTVNLGVTPEDTRAASAGQAVRDAAAACERATGALD